MSQENLQPETTRTPSTDLPSSAPKAENPFLETIRFAAIALLIVLPIRWFIAQPFIVSGASMEETFHDSEYLIVDQLTYRFEEPKRGDVIIFRYPLDHSKFFIKRVIGVPGDTVSVDGQTVTITNAEHPEGMILNETYVNGSTKENNTTLTLGPDEYFVMGDNRDHSSDSRSWGVLQKEEIVGRAFLRLFPPAKADILPGAYELN